MAHVRRQEDAGDVGSVGFEFRNRDQACDVPDGDEAPDVDRAVHAVANSGAEQ